MTTKLSDLTAQTTVEGLVGALGLDMTSDQERTMAVLTFAMLKGASALTSIANTMYAQGAPSTKAAQDMARAALKDAGLS